MPPPRKLYESRIVFEAILDIGGWVYLDDICAKTALSHHVAGQIAGLLASIGLIERASTRISSKEIRSYRAVAGKQFSDNLFEHEYARRSLGKGIQHNTVFGRRDPKDREKQGPAILPTTELEPKASKSPNVEAIRFHLGRGMGLAMLRRIYGQQAVHEALEGQSA